MKSNLAVMTVVVSGKMRIDQGLINHELPAWIPHGSCHCYMLTQYPVPCFPLCIYPFLVFRCISGTRTICFFLFPLQCEADLLWIMNKALNIKITICNFVVTISFCFALVHNFCTLPMTLKSCKNIL